MTEQLHNYSPGPALLPQEVHQQIHEDLKRGFGALPLLEISHRSPAFVEIADSTEQSLRNLLQIPNDYHILFLAGGATAQYAMVPMNLASEGGVCDYINTGHWSARAVTEAQKYSTVNTVAAVNLQADGRLGLPDISQWCFSEHADYCHFVDNETLTGFELPTDLVQSRSPLVSDMTSNFLSRRFDIRQFGVVYAGTQKNVGIAGLAIVIVRHDLLGRARDFIPSLQNYTVQAEARSCHNTPPIFSWYVCGLVLEWTKRQGGIDMMEKRSAQRSNYLYQCIDDSVIYSNEISPAYRSRMNIHFRIKPERLEKEFLQRAEQQGLMGLRGHRAVGGIRASLYNAMPIAGAETLVDFMQDFEKTI